MMETGQLYFLAHSAMRCRARVTAPGYRSVRGFRCGGAFGAARLSVRRLSVRRETGYCHSGTAGTGTYAVDAPFMLLERNAACLSALPDVLKPHIQCVRTHWMCGFIAFQWPDAQGMWCWWCRRGLSPILWNERRRERPRLGRNKPGGGRGRRGRACGRGWRARGADGAGRGRGPRGWGQSGDGNSGLTEGRQEKTE